MNIHRFDFHVLNQDKPTRQHFYLQLFRSQERGLYRLLRIIISLILLALIPMVSPLVVQFMVPPAQVLTLILAFPRLAPLSQVQELILNQHLHRLISRLQSGLNHYRLVSKGQKHRQCIEILEG